MIRTLFLMLTVLLITDARAADDPCAFFFGDAMKLTGDEPRRAFLTEILSAKPTRPSVAPPFPGGSARPRADQFLNELRDRVVAAGFRLEREDETARSGEFECAMTALRRIEGSRCALGRFIENPRAYVLRRFDQVQTPASGDLVLYSSTAQTFHALNHASVVRSIGDDNTVRVESKFGRVPGIFVHRLGESPRFYGDYVSFFRVKPDPEIEARRKPSLGPRFPGLVRRD